MPTPQSSQATRMPERSLLFHGPGFKSRRLEVERRCTFCLGSLHFLQGLDAISPLVGGESYPFAGPTGVQVHVFWTTGCRALCFAHVLHKQMGTCGCPT